MSILFKGRSQGASDTRIGIVQMITAFYISHARQALGSLGELWRQPAASIMTVAVLGLSCQAPCTFW